MVQEKKKKKKKDNENNENKNNSNKIYEGEYGMSENEEMKI